MVNVSGNKILTPDAFWLESVGYFYLQTLPLQHLTDTRNLKHRWQGHTAEGHLSGRLVHSGHAQAFLI